MEKVTIILNKEQAHSVMAALELYSRVHMGQFDNLDWEFVTHGVNRDFWRDQGKRDELRSLLNRAKQIIFPELVQNSYQGICSTKIPNSARDAWDLYQSLRHKLSWYNNPNPDDMSRWSNSYSEPFKTSTEHKVPVVTVEKVEEDV